MVEKGAVKLQYVATEEQTADIFTKPLARTKLEHFRGQAWCGPSKEGMTSSSIGQFYSVGTRVVNCRWTVCANIRNLDHMRNHMEFGPHDRSVVVLLRLGYSYRRYSGWTDVSLV